MDEQLAQQQLKMEQAQHAKQQEMQDQDRARQAAAGALPKKSEISGVEFALIGLLAISKDVADIIGDIAIIGPIINIITNVVCLPILWIWCYIRLGKFPIKRFLASGIGEFIPYIDALPFWTFFVVTVFLEQKGYIPGFIKKLTKPIPGKT